MGTDACTDAQCLKRFHYRFFVETCRKIFRQRFTWLGKSRLQKSFELRIVARTMLDDPQNRRDHFGCGDESFRGHIEADMCLARLLGQYRECGKVSLARSGGKLFGDLFLHHDQQALAVGVFQRTQNDIRRDVIGEVGDQMVGPVGQTRVIPLAEDIRAMQNKPSFFDGLFEASAQMPAKVFVHLISGDILNLDQISGQIT